MFKKCKFKKFIIYLLQKIHMHIITFKNWFENILLHCVKIYQKESNCADSILLLLNRKYQHLIPFVKDLQFEYDFIEIHFYSLIQLLQPMLYYIIIKTLLFSFLFFFNILFTRKTVISNSTNILYNLENLIKTLFLFWKQ